MYYASSATGSQHSAALLQGLIFVVDSNDRDRIGEARDELHRMLNEVQGALPTCGAAPPCTTVKRQAGGAAQRAAIAIAVT
jgi:ADP-ribosylation factor family